MIPCDKLFTRLQVDENSSADDCTRTCHRLHGIPTTVVFMPSENFNVLFVTQKSNALGTVYKVSTSMNIRNADVECVFGQKNLGVMSRSLYREGYTNCCRITILENNTIISV